MRRNITLDFTVNKTVESLTADQEMAIMPAELAKELLRHYAELLARSTPDRIIRKHVDNLINVANNEVGAVDAAVKISLAWIQERDLIQNIAHENWNAYAVEQAK